MAVKHITEFRDLGDAELVDRMAATKEELFNLRFQLATGSSTTTPVSGPSARTWPASTPCFASGK